MYFNQNIYCRFGVNAFLGGPRSWKALFKKLMSWLIIHFTHLSGIKSILCVQVVKPQWLGDLCDLREANLTCPDIKYILESKIVSQKLKCHSRFTQHASVSYAKDKLTRLGNNAQNLQNFNVFSRFKNCKKISST